MTGTAPETASENHARITPDLIARLMQLSDNDRAKVACLMWDSLEGPQDDPQEYKQAVKEELAWRIEEDKAGRMKSYTMEEFFERLRKEMRGESEHT